jgi:hypothetical protein
MNATPQGLGELQSVVVARVPLAARQPLSRARIGDELEIRRIPATFVAPDALSNPAQALDRRPAAAIPAGGYLVASQLLAPRTNESDEQEVGAGRSPVEITVSAAGPLIGSPRRIVDVVVTGEPTMGAGGGRTYVAAQAVKLLDLRPAGGEAEVAAPPSAGAGELSVATLALTRAQALQLIHAQSFAREVRLIATVSG